MKKGFIAILAATLSIGAVSAAEAGVSSETVPQKSAAAVKKCEKCKKQPVKHECKKGQCAKSECRNCKKKQAVKRECGDCRKKEATKHECKDCKKKRNAAPVTEK